MSQQDRDHIQPPQNVLRFGNLIIFLTECRNFSKKEVDPVYTTLREAAGFRSMRNSKSDELDGGECME